MNGCIIIPLNYEITPQHISPPSSLGKVPFIVVEVLTQKIQLEGENCLQEHDQDFIAASRDFEANGSFIRASWAMFCGAWFQAIVVPELLNKGGFPFHCC